MKTDKPLKPKLFNQAERDFWSDLRLEELQALDELEVAFATQDPVVQSKALGRLKRTMMDYFAQKYLDYCGNYSGRPAYYINYKYHTEWQNGVDFSILTEIKEIDARPPMNLPLAFYNG